MLFQATNLGVICYTAVVVANTPLPSGGLRVISLPESSITLGLKHVATLTTHTRVLGQAREPVSKRREYSAPHWPGGFFPVCLYLCLPGPSWNTDSLHHPYKSSSLEPQLDSGKVSLFPKYCKFTFSPPWTKLSSDSAKQLASSGYIGSSCGRKNHFLRAKGFLSFKLQPLLWQF